MAYKRVEYIQTNQTYLLTNLKTGSLTKYVIDVELVSVTGDNGVMGNAAGTWKSAAFNLMVNDGRREWGVYIAGTPYDHCNYYNIGNRCTVELTKNGITVYDTVLSAYTSNVTFSGNAPTTSTNNIRIGSGIENNRMGVYKFYEVTVFSGDTIVGHYLPYKDETTGYGVLYDSVSNTYLNGYIPSAVTAGPLYRTFETDITAITAAYNSTTCAVTLTADEDMAWTASTLNDWITLSTTGGTGSSVFTVSLSKNTAYTQRAGTVSLTNGEDVIEIVCTQEKYPLLIPKNNIYRGGTLVN